ncbi:MAG: SAM-dependent chlorinase/fluorinase [Thermoplasmata archaeon]|jgi:S-adenosylmethionine hydrolase
MPPGRSLRSRAVTLSSDIGWAYAAQMKAVLYRSLPPGRVIDLAHDLPAHAPREAGLWLAAMAERFPAGTIHVAIVDPGVGTDRAAIVIVARDGSVLIGPDNGLLVPLARRLGIGKVWAIDERRLDAGPRRGTTFDGRDLFAPAAVAVWEGRPFQEWARPGRLTESAVPAPVRTPGRWVGVVLLVDRFGNLITNLPSEWIPAGPLRLRLGRGPARTVRRVNGYAEIRGSALGCLPSSFGTIEISAREQSAAGRTGARSGTRVELASPARVRA